MTDTVSTVFPQGSPMARGSPPIAASTVAFGVYASIQKSLSFAVSFVPITQTNTKAKYAEDQKDRTYFRRFQTVYSNTGPHKYTQEYFCGHLKFIKYSRKRSGDIAIFLSYCTACRHNCKQPCKGNHRKGILNNIQYKNDRNKQDGLHSRINMQAC